MTITAIIPPELSISVLLLLIISLPTLALIDILNHKFEGNDKLIWVIVVILMNIIGVLLYFIIGRHQKRPPHSGER